MQALVAYSRSCSSRPASPGQRPGQGIAIFEGEPAGELFGEQQGAGELVLAERLTDPVLGQGEQLWRVAAQLLGVPQGAHRGADGGHGHAAEPGGALEVPLPVLAGAVVGGGLQQLLEPLGELVNRCARHGRPG